MGSVPPLIAMSFIIFSAYRKKELAEFQRNIEIGERGAGLAVNSAILMVTGIPGIPVVFAKEYFLNKGRQKKQVIDELEMQLESQAASFKNSRTPSRNLSRRRFLKYLALSAPAGVKARSM